MQKSMRGISQYRPIPLRSPQTTNASTFTATSSNICWSRRGCKLPLRYAYGLCLRIPVSPFVTICPLFAEVKGTTAWVALEYLSTYSRLRNFCHYLDFLFLMRPTLFSLPHFPLESLRQLVGMRLFSLRCVHRLSLYASIYHLLISHLPLLLTKVNAQVSG